MILGWLWLAGITACIESLDLLFLIQYTGSCWAGSGEWRFMLGEWGGEFVPLQHSAYFVRQPRLMLVDVKERVGLFFGRKKGKVVCEEDSSEI